MSFKILGLFATIVILCNSAECQQRKIVILGSSTAAGQGASVPDSSWVGRLRLLFNKNTSDGVDTTVTSLAISGYTTYHVMPTSYTPPPDRPSPNPTQNITAALSLSPDIIIINMPTNDIANGYSKMEYMNNLRTISQIARTQSQPVKCFITTTQPRSLDAPQRLMLRELVDSVNNSFGIFALNFWDDLVSTDGQYFIRPEVAVGDGIHINDLGHRLVFERVRAKNMFSIATAPLPLSLVSFDVTLSNNKAVVKWRSEKELANTVFEIQRSANGADFTKLASQQAKAGGQANDYSWVDAAPLGNKSFYRLKIIEPGKTSYSKVVSVTNKAKQFSIQKLYVNASSLHIDVSSEISQPVVISVMNVSGAVIEKKSYQLSTSNNKFVLQVSQLAAGEYIVNVVSANGTTDVRKFAIVK